MQRPSHGFLMAGISHERPMAFGDTSQSRIRHLLNGVLSLSEVTGEDEIFVEGGNGCKGAIDGGRREKSLRHSVKSGCIAHQAHQYTHIQHCTLHPLIT